MQVVVKRSQTLAQTETRYKVTNHPVNKRQSTDYDDDYDDVIPSSGSERRRKNLDSTIDKLLDSKERL